MVKSDFPVLQLVCCLSSFRAKDMKKISLLPSLLQQKKTLSFLNLLLHVVCSSPVTSHLCDCARLAYFLNILLQVNWSPFFCSCHLPLVSIPSALWISKCRSGCWYYPHQLIPASTFCVLGFDCTSWLFHLCWCSAVLAPLLCIWLEGSCAFKRFLLKIRWLFWVSLPCSAVSFGNLLHRS